MNDISYLLAFSAGLLSFLSPCVLPLLPAYIGYMTGNILDEIHDKKANIRALTNSLGFVLGFSIIFVLMGASATTLGKLLLKNQDIFRKIGGSLMIVFGLHTIGFFKIKLFYYEKRLFPLVSLSKKLNPILMGMAFATGWTPCIGPILSSILIYASNQATISKGILLLSMYSLGLAIPFILTTFGIEKFSKHLLSINKKLRIISIITGILLIIMGVLVFTNKMNILSSYLNFINFY